MTLNDLTIVVCCNKKDFFFARICIASIRYFYSSIDIEIVPDYGNGYFNTKELETSFNVKKIDFGIKKLGWSGAKFHYLYKAVSGKKILLLDADIVFTGNFIERLLPQFEKSDYIVSIEVVENPYEEWVKQIYFDTKKIEAQFPLYKFPGYFFNAGQIFVTTGSISKDVLNEHFDPSKYPFWKNQSLFPLVDQSVYNYLLPTLSTTNNLILGTAEFMMWSKSTIVADLELKDIQDGILQNGLIHWAGDKRVATLSGMTRKDILIFFQQYYYSKVPNGKLKKGLRNFIALSEQTLRYLYSKLKKIVKK